jgi:hypothetical protein
MNGKINGQWKVVASILAAVVSIFVIVSSVNSNIDERIDLKLLDHRRAEAEMIGKLRTEVAVTQTQLTEIKKQLDRIEDRLPAK